MTLPFPHGAASGQIAHNSSYDTGVTPGSVGGKFIGFGEEGTSAIANRANWALSTNINYCWEKLSADLAMPELASWTVGAGAGALYTFLLTPDVWCGDVGYTGQEGLDRLFTLLDEDYNQLIDPTDSTKVVVRTVRDALDVDILGDGFQPTPVIKFKTVNPITGADASNPYVIPDGTVVKIFHARKGSLETLTTDAFSKIPIRVAEEAPAGVVFQDGSRPMTGNLNFDGNRATNITEIDAEAGTDLVVAGSGAETLRLVDWLSIYFEDGNVGAYLHNVGEPDSLGQNTSLYGALSSAFHLNQAIHGNRVLSKTGSFTFTDVTGAVAYPATELILNGEQRSLAGGTVNAPNGFNRVLVADVSGVIQQRDPSAVVVTDVPLAYYRWDGATFLVKLDIRWSLTARSAGFEIAVGDDGSGNLIPGCDFIDLDSAIALVEAMSNTALMGQTYTIKVHGSVTISDTIHIKTPVRIIGENGAVLKATHGVGVHTLDGYDFLPAVTLEGLTFYWDNGAAQSLGYAAIANMGPGSRIINCKFERSTVSNYGFYNAMLWDQTVDNVLIEGCWADVGGSLVLGVTSTSPFQDRLTYSTIRQCYAKNATGTSSPEFAIDAGGIGNIVEGCRVDGSIDDGFDQGIRIGDQGEVRKCWVYGTTVSYGIAVMTNATSVINSVTVKDNVVMNCSTAFMASQPGGYDPRQMHVQFSGNSAVDNDSGFLVLNGPTEGPEGCSYRFMNNSVYNAASGAMAFLNGRSVVVEGNEFREVYGNCIEVGDNTEVKILNNKIFGFNGYAIYVTSTAAKPSLIQGNTIHGANADSTDAMIRISTPNSTIVNNKLIVEGGEEVSIGIQTSVSSVRIQGNYFYNLGEISGSGGCLVATNASGSTKTGLVFSGNTVKGRNETVAVSVFGFEGTILEGNSFLAGDYQALNVAPYPASSETVDGTVLRGNTFYGVGGIVTGPNSYVVNVGYEPFGSYPNGLVIEGNTFKFCGTSADVWSILLQVMGTGVVRGNTFIDCLGYEANPTAGGTIAINTGSSGWMVEGNQFYQDIEVVLPRYFILIESITGPGNSFHNNCLTLTGNVAGWTGGTFRFIDSDQDYNTCSGNRLNHSGGSLAGGTSIYSINLTGDSCIVMGNLIQQYPIHNDGELSVVIGNLTLQSGGVGLYAAGDHSVVSGNSVPGAAVAFPTNMHPDRSAAYQSNAAYPGLDANHYSGY